MPGTQGKGADLPAPHQELLRFRVALDVRARSAVLQQPDHGSSRP